MTVLLGLSKTSYVNFRKQNNFVVHYLRPNPCMSICRRRVPYQFRFATLPRNAILCDKCRSSQT